MLIDVHESDSCPDPHYFELLRSQGKDKSWMLWKSLAVSIHPSPKILELGAGCGNLALPLANDGISITAVDRDPYAFSFISSFKSPFLEPVHADIMTLDLQRRFDLVIMKSSLLNLFSAVDQKRCFLTAAKHLNPNGLFVAEVYQQQWLAEGREFSNVHQYIRCHEEVEPGLWRVEGLYHVGEIDYRLEVLIRHISDELLHQLASFSGLIMKNHRMTTNPITEFVQFTTAKF
jgi:precorrin-6B methylase 2